MRLIFILIIGLNAFSSHVYAKCSKSEALLAFEKGGLWGIRDPNGTVRIEAQFRNVTNHSDLGFIYADGYFWSLDGEKLFQAFIYDNGPDYLSEGFMRFRQNAKVGFLDKCLKETIKATFDFATPFKNGISFVCQSCQVVSEEENSRLIKGLWGAIDYSGKIILPTKHDKATAEKLRNNIK